MAALSVAASAVHAAPRAASLGSVRARCPAKTRGALRAAPARATRARDVGVRAVQEVAGADFQAEVLDSDVPVLVDFWATWCGPCKLISKVVEKAADEYPADKLKIVKIEVDPNPELVEKYEVYGLPTIVLFKDGEVVSGSKREGAINLPKLKDHLATHGVEAA